MMEHFGVSAQWNGNSVYVPPKEYEPKEFSVEADWSSASYWYAMAALADDVDLRITGLRKNSLQGDSVMANLGVFFGVKTEFLSNGIRLAKVKRVVDRFAFDFSDCPDIAQTVAVLSAALKMPMALNGIQSLKIKETDRIQALVNELAKTGAAARNIKDCCLEIKKFENISPGSNTIFLSYDDHRMTMALAPLALVYDSVKIENPDSVKKSYPDFWKDLKSVGFKIEER
jgi:3-phosphoshikimate 1-carboxyvinyltransferase